MFSQSTKLVLFVAVLFGLAACGRSHENGDRSANPDSAAGKSGQAAYQASKETEKAAKVIGRETEKAAKELSHKASEAARDAHAGWKDASERDKAKHD